MSAPPRTVRILPVEPEPGARSVDAFIVSPPPAELIGRILPSYLRTTVYRALVENAAGEQGARRAAMETGEFSRLGSSVVRKPDIRIIAATNRDLGAAIAEGQFRGGLVDRMRFYYEVPSRRERRGEIAGIAHRSLRAKGARWELTDDAMSRLRSHHWPGNVRELRKVVLHCTCSAADGMIGLDLVEAGIRNQRVVRRPNLADVAEPPKPKSDDVMKLELL